MVGVAAENPIPRREWLREGCKVIAHRGPDDEGLWWSNDGHVGLAHRRLAIVDLSAAGHQPMLDATGEIVIAFNGEIYNFRELRAELEAMGHQFRSHSDTEVILAAYRSWGDACLERLDGMFALALFDQRTRQLLLARDRAGEKPLFYRLDRGELRFASELKALLVDETLPREVDRESMDAFLSMGYVPGSRCILRGFRKLPAAHAMRFDLASGDTRIWQYWQLPEYDPAAAGSEGDLLDELEQLLDQAVRRQLVADVPVGILLSGGLDSSLVTAMAARNAARLKTFTIRFPGHGKFDESGHARLIANAFGTDHLELEAEEGAADLLPRLAWQIDEPMADSSMVPTFLVSQLVRQHCTVALGGDGGDELFGGYGYYAKLLQLQQKMRSMPRSAGRMAAWLATHHSPLGVGGSNLRAWVQALGTDMSRDLPLIGSFFDRPSRQRLMGNRSGWPYHAEAIHSDAVPPDPDLIQRVTRLDFKHYLAEDILVKVDRMSMLNALEMRAPMLDRHLIEFAMRKVPASLKTNAGQKKILLQKLAERVLPPEFDRQRKQGFSIPLKHWLTGGPFKRLFEEVLLDPASTFDRRYVSSLLRGQEKGRANEERLFALVMFELWRKHYGAIVR
ncbi:asparagine synthase (glutamine-hydrolyzing) [Sphingomonas sp. Root241]|uniref:asparagine synthase (glutamine-hydrolyzing) n=1 Tax=Sphingomonas sp. Root241 TaxID=1736501 RepID=UPI001910845A|nr:asparagine synthase (glutamine-hydrolyzing) [Sphingomonas sp. Root241]